MKNNKQILIIGLIIFIIIVLAIFSPNFINFDDLRSSEPNLISDLSYNKNKSLGYTVYIKESDEYIPYLVLTNNYNGNTLLLRKYLLDRIMAYSDDSLANANGSYSGYYPQNSVDNYLNNSFITTLSLELQNIILDTDISVSTIEGVGSSSGLKSPEKINRKIFLLSATELNVKSSMATVEGNPLDYFKTSENLITTSIDGAITDYWLRSAYHWDDHQAWAVSLTPDLTDSLVGGWITTNLFGVRPAFCLPNNTKIEKDSTIIKGDTVWKISDVIK